MWTKFGDPKSQDVAEEFSVVNFSFFVKIGGGGRFATIESKFFNISSQ
jgi:hypothetical protein